METHSRSVAKAVSWRIFGMIQGALIVWLFTRDLTLAATVGVVETTVKMFTFYLHERAWNRIHFGRPRPPDYEI